VLVLDVEVLQVCQVGNSSRNIAGHVILIGVEVVQICELANGLWEWARQLVLVHPKAPQVGHVTDLFRNGTCQCIVPCVEFVKFAQKTNGSWDGSTDSTLSSIPIHVQVGKLSHVANGGRDGACEHITVQVENLEVLKSNVSIVLESGTPLIWNLSSELIVGQIQVTQLGWFPRESCGRNRSALC